jgi:pilus assembly protein Flp/PilA
MKNLKQLVKNLIAEDSGQDLVEYALIAVLVGLGTVATMKSLATSVGTVFGAVGTTLTTGV